nr:MAG TPA: hypothetical protein [Caudoviricetes sp.]
MPYYVKVTKKVREALLPAYLVVQRTFDDNYLLFQSALSKVEGNTLSERCAAVGGSLITPQEVAGEINGTSSAPCHTPKEYGGDDEKETDKIFSPGTGDVTSDAENTTTDANGGNVEVHQPEENKNESETSKEESEVADDEK